VSRRFLALATALVALNLSLWFATASFGLGGSLRALPGFLFGPQLMRAEVVLTDGSDYLIDRGRLMTNASVDSVTLREADGRVVTIPVSPSAEVTLGARTVPLQRLRRGMLVTTVRPGEAPATIVVARR
jgi:hypothetical protein